MAGREHLARGTVLYDPSCHRSHALLYGQDPGVYCRLVAAWGLCLLGYPDQALQRNYEARVLAHTVGDPVSLAASHVFFAVTHQCRREGAEAHKHAEAAIELAAQHRFPYFRAFGMILRGWALAEQGHRAEGLDQMREGLTAYQATGAKLLRVRFLALLAEQYGKGGQSKQGLHVLAEARVAMTHDGARDYDAELYRLKGELLLLQERQRRKTEGKRQEGGRTRSSSRQTPQLKPFVSTEVAQEVEECFLKAISLARQQRMKVLELRAVVSLVRLRQQQVHHAASTTAHTAKNKLAEAQSMLGDLYNRFSEGFATTDVQEAKALLDNLAANFPSLAEERERQ